LVVNVEPSPRSVISLGCLVIDGASEMIELGLDSNFRRVKNEVERDRLPGASVGRDIPRP
jgi:hypothetical protein